MGTKNRLLEILESERGRYISGEELARRLSVSRAGIWKQIRSLREAGYAIAAVKNKGYCLDISNDRLSLEGMLPYLEYPALREKIFVFDTLDSTNNELKRREIGGAPSGTVVIANQQNAGRGRLGRSFYSPAGGGVYFSILLRPSFSMDRAVLTTVAASVAAARAVFAVTGRYPEIKWVNDLYMDGKKVCGILTEAIAGFETGAMEAVVVGIGINCGAVFPEELQRIAGNVRPENENTAFRNRLAAELVNRVSKLESMIEKQDFLSEYREHSMVIGKYITLLQEPGSCYLAEGIGENGELILRSSDGRKRFLNTGEISIRMMETSDIDK